MQCIYQTITLFFLSDICFLTNYQRFVPGAYPLRYLNFCATDVCGAYSGGRRGPVLFEALRVVQNVFERLRYSQKSRKV